jgi:phosphate transport system substrate-binding protein
MTLMNISLVTAARSAGRFALAIAGSIVLAAGATAHAEDLRIGGTGNALGAMKLLADEFGKRNPDVKVAVLPSLGTSGAIKAIPKGALDIGLSSRPLAAEEEAQGAVAMEYARTPLVFAVAKKSGATALGLDELARIYEGSLAKWPDGSQIRPVLRQAGDDNTKQVIAMSPALAKAMMTAEQRPGLPFATTDQEAAEKMERIPGAVGVTTLGLMISEARDLRALKIDGVEATAANGASGRYPHFKRLYLITQPAQSAAVKRFIAYVQSPDGRAILVRTGHWIP